MRTRMVAALLLLLAFWQQAGAQQADKGQVELFSGAELYYRDINYVRLYDVLLNLTPGVKWHLGHDWQVAGQALLPVWNDGYPKQHVALGMAVVSKQLHPGASQHFKLSAGFFSRHRCGLDLRWMMPVTPWLLLQAQGGLTNGYTLDASETRFFEQSLELTALAGFNVFVAPWGVEARLQGGRYLNGKLGTELSVMRHFSHCTVQAFAQLHERAKGAADWHARGSEAGGFRLVMMLPPYKKHEGKLVVRPASNFRLTYNAQADTESMTMYATDPEENERELPIDVPWGTGAAQ